MADSAAQFRELIERCIALQASDLHLSSGVAPYVRIHGQLQPLTPEPLAPALVEEIALALMLPRQRDVFQQQLSLDLSFSPRPDVRFRVNVFRERGRVAMAFRRIDDRLRTWDELHLPPQLADLADLRDGLVLMTGPTGSGKSTTLATMIHQINCSRACHIVTIEDPLEYIHDNVKSLVQQRELYTDVPSFADAVRAVLREDPDVILVGELRDADTMRAAITAAETGHLVFSTLHTGDAAGALDRVIGVFSAEEQISIRQQLSMTLRAVIAQRLLPRAGGEGRIPVVEVLRVTTGVAHLIRTGKPQQIYSAIETGFADGMQTLEQSLADAVSRGLVRTEDALRLARDPKIFSARLQLAQKPRV